jgi:hypothetical protein
MSEKKADGRNQWAIMYEVVTGASAPDHHEEAPGATTESTKAGHEPDKFNAKTIVLVPVFVVATCIFAYIVITGLFTFLSPGKVISDANTDQTSATAATKDFNSRVNRISSSDESAPAKAPRLEYMKNLDNKRNGVEDPPYLRSFLPTNGGNTYEITPQDLYPERFVDPQTGKKTLIEYHWVSQEKGIVSIPISEAIKALAGKLPAKTTPVSTSFAGNAKQSNGGHAVAVKPPVAAAVEKKADHKPGDKH